MSLPALPVFDFGPWRRWGARDRLSSDLDVPPDFGILGLYLLAMGGEAGPPVGAPGTPPYLLPSVVYIGMSRHVDRRLGGSHDAVRRYQARYIDPTCVRLWYCTWQSSWNNQERDAHKVALANASLAFYERALILAHVESIGTSPALNRL